jgi:hypothetical protein
MNIFFAALYYGLFAFAIIYGVLWVRMSIKLYCAAIPIRSWCRRRMCYLGVNSLWGIGYVAFGLASFIPHPVFVKVCYSICGVSNWLMVFAPCTTPIFNTNSALRVIRALMFVGVGALPVAYVLRV